MAAIKHVRKTKTPVVQSTNKSPAFRSGLFTFVAAFMGVAVGFVASLSVVMPMIKNEFADQSQQLSHQLVSMMPADDTLSSCVQPNTGATTSSGHILGASTTAQTSSSTPPAGGSGGGAPSGPSTVFVSKLVSGVFAHTTTTMSNTGPYSDNSIKTTNVNKTIVNNDNDITAVSNNSQSASSGSAGESTNTTGGNAQSGEASNVSSSNETISVNN